jgi:hypothetical protein
MQGIEAKLKRGKKRLTLQGTEGNEEHYVSHGEKISQCPLWLNLIYSVRIEESGDGNSRHHRWYRFWQS